MVQGNYVLRSIDLAKSVGNTNGISFNISNILRAREIDAILHIYIFKHIFNVFYLIKINEIFSRGWIVNTS